MSLGPVMVGIKGTSLLPEERDMLRHPSVGAVILFMRNYESRAQVTQLCADIHALRAPPLLIAVDHEGGRVQRFRTEFTRLPAARSFGVLYDQDRARALHLAEVTGWLMASELRAVGIDFSFAPVLDLDYGVSRVIGDRAFHRDAQSVSALALRFMRGMKEAGMPATAKHFPGHGFVEADSHLEIAVDPRRYSDLVLDDLIPFQRLIRNGLAAIMPAHVIYKNIAPDPAGFSTFWLRDVLRKQLEFQGVIFSDDLEMEGASLVGDIVDRARAALAAGCDMVLACNDSQKIAQLVQGLPDSADPASALRLVRLHGRGHVTWEQLAINTRWQHAVTAVEPGTRG